MPYIDKGYWLEYSSLRELPQFMLDDAAQRRWSIPDGSIYHNQADLYRRLSWLNIAVSTVAAIGAAAPFEVRRRAGEKLISIPNHPFELLLERPNPLHSRFELLEATFAYRALCGNSYWWLNRAAPDAPIDEIWCIPPYAIRPIPDGNMYLSGYAFSPEGTFGDVWVTNPPYFIPAWQILHLKSFNPLDSFVGESNVAPLATVATADLRAQQYNANFFGDDNAKAPGALAYSDMVNDGDWRRIQQDFKDQHGGVRRKLMMLRGAGQKGVQWVQMGLTQDEMQFLQSRQFTKEEIFGMVAPGLASVLDVNATEANAKVGRAALIEFCVWPMLDALGQKITNTLLPLYDRRSAHGLIGAFKDIRPTDKELELREQERAAELLSLDEMRERYYSLPPLPAGVSPAARAGAASLQQSGAPDVQPTPLKANLRTNEQALYDSLRAALEQRGDVAGALRTALAPVFNEVAAMVAQTYGVPLAGIELPDFLSSYLPLALGALASAASAGGGGQDPFGWLIRFVVAVITRGRAWITDQLNRWFQTSMFDDQLYELVWRTVGDDRVCPICIALDGTPKRLLTNTVEPGDVHPFCRCEWKLAAVPADVLEQLTKAAAPYRNGFAHA